MADLNTFGGPVSDLRHSCRRGAAYGMAEGTDETWQRHGMAGGRQRSVIPPAEKHRARPTKPSDAPGE
jgi:hypothetical protein